MKTGRLLLLLASSIALSPFAAHGSETCFTKKTKTSEAVLKLDLPDMDGVVTGRQSGVVHDDEQGYYTSWESAVSGTRKGNRLQVTLETRIEDDLQRNEEVWMLVPEGIRAGDDVYGEEDCASATVGGDLAASDEEDQPQAPEDGRGQCGEAESVVFTCPLDNDHMVSVCRVGDRSSLTFRYGTPTAPDFVFPNDGDQLPERFMYNMIPYSGGYDAGLGFRSGKKTYVLHEEMTDKGGGEKDISGRLVIYEGSRIETEAACRTFDDGASGLNSLSGIVPEKAFFDENGLTE